VSTGPSAEPVELTIYGAASLKGPLEAAKAAYETTKPGATVTLSTGSSAALETQI
jgi:ABC-type molybdate transport system substrate-binding protein